MTEATKAADKAKADAKADKAEAEQADKADHLAPGIKEQAEAAVNRPEPDPNLIFSDRHLKPGEKAPQSLPDNGPFDKPKGGDNGVKGMGETTFSKGGQYVPEKEKPE